MTNSAETRAFATALRALKDRSGLSYGTLATRLHVSTSTLHRYCAGDAVPLEYATVDRFARQCAATRSEMAELHRAWLLADAQRARADAAPAAPMPAAPVPAVPASADRPARRRPAALRAGVAAAAVVTLVAVAGGAWLARGPSGDVAAGPGGGPAAADPAAAPLTWTVRTDLWNSGCDHTYLIDRQAADVPAPPLEQDAAAWADPLGAVDANRTIVEVTVAGEDAEPVVLQGLFVRVADRRAPVVWSAYSMSDGCGGAASPTSFAVNLDAPRPLARPVAGSDGERPLPAPAFPIEVSASDPALLRIEASTETCDCDWRLELAWATGERSGTVRLDDDGAPFRTSAADPGATLGFGGTPARWR